MEDMARLALIEQNVGNSVQFNKLLLELLEHITDIIENPQNPEIRTWKSVMFEQFLNVKGLADYLTYVGFNIKNDEIIYPVSLNLNNLKIARAAITRKLHFTGASVKVMSQLNSKMGSSQIAETSSKLAPVNILMTNNQFLLKIQSLFNEVLKYEDEELQRKAQEAIPLYTLQLKAQDRLREHQRKLKSGEIKGNDMSFDMALLVELVLWFKYSFFKWVDKPNCESCGNETEFQRSTMMNVGSEVCRVEMYRCPSCGATTTFPRYNSPATLLTSRRGRCGEWANCFALLCRSLRYDTRYVYDVTDHVWTEIYDYEAQSWIHVDPCEGKVNAPLMYEHGWGKKISYVIAVSKDDIQDVTWRYTSEHRGALARRLQCSESELVTSLVTLRAHRQRHVTTHRRMHLARRAAVELADMMTSRKPSDYENEGRISGSMEWRLERGEAGHTGHIFNIDSPGDHRIEYCTALDMYTVSMSDRSTKHMKSYRGGAFKCKDVFRKEETDWKMVYLARKEGTPSGSVSWRIAAADDLILTSIIITGTSKVYETGSVTWTIQFDDEQPTAFELKETPVKYEGRFKKVTLEVAMSGGVGSVAWQHAQLFRQPADSETTTFEIQLIAENVS